MNVTERIASFVKDTSLDDIPRRVIQAAKEAILDTLGVMMAGVTEPVSCLVTNYIRDLGGKPEAVVVGQRLRTSPSLAALANGTMAHALDYDDQNWALHGHASAVVLPAVLAMGEASGASGRELLEAYIVGFEVAGALGRGMNMRHYYNGWHATGTLGTMGAAAGVAKLLGLSKPRIQATLGCAASQASSLRANFGTMTKPLHAGLAAEHGVRAAELVSRGLTARSDILENPVGFCVAFCGERGYDLKVIVESLGHPFVFELPGNNLKPYPCCISAHAAIDALRELRVCHGLTPSKVKTIECRLLDVAIRNLSYSTPATGLEGKFSAEYCLVRILFDGDLRLSHFTDEAVHSPEIQDWLPRIQVRVDPSLTWTPGTTRPAVVTVHTTDGQSLTYRADKARGTPEWPMTREEILFKFRDCGNRVLPPAALESVQRLVESIETLSDVRKLTKDISKRHAMTLSAQERY